MYYKIRIKKFKGKACVYCGTENSSQTGNHVFAKAITTEI